MAEKVAAKDDEKKNKDESFFRSVWESAKDSASTMASVRWGLVSGVSCCLMTIRTLQSTAYNAPTLTPPSQLVSKPFTALGRPAIRSILAEIRELRKVFAAAGISVDAESGWLCVTVGTYVGMLKGKENRLSTGLSDHSFHARLYPLHISSPVNHLTPRTGLTLKIGILEEARSQLLEFETTGLSLMQRVLLTILSRAHRYAVAASGDTLEPHVIFLSISGLGLAVPSVSATVQLGPVTQKPAPPEVVSKALADMATEKAAAEEKAKAAATETAAADPTLDVSAEKAKKAAEEKPAGGSRIRNFVLEAVDDVAEEATFALSATSAATLRAVYATGSAAAQVQLDRE